MTEVEDITKDITKDITEKIEEIKKNTKKLYIVGCVNLILAISLVVLFITSFTEFGIFRDTPIPIKLFWLVASAINFFAVFKTIPVIKKSKKFISKTKIDFWDGVREIE